MRDGKANRPRGQRRRLHTASQLCAAGATGLFAPLAFAGAAVAYSHTYWSFYGGYARACCGHRLYWTSQPNNGGNAISQPLVFNHAGHHGSSYPALCVQEYVRHSFYDTPACGTGVAYHSLNGANYDQPLCWTNVTSGANVGCYAVWL